MRTSLTKYAVAWGLPYIYFSISSNVAISINPEVILDEDIDMFNLLLAIFHLNFRNINIIINCIKFNGLITRAKPSNF